MQYLEFRRNFQDFTVFSLSDIRSVDSAFHRRRLTEWQKKGYIVKVIKGYYIFSDLKLNERLLFEIANRIYSPSYISFETALSYYGLIPENVYGLTSASTRRTYAFRTKMGNFSYRAIDEKLFFGYNLIERGGKSFKIASPEKAFLDYFYINARIDDSGDYAELRVNPETFFKLMHKNTLEDFLKKFGQKRLTERVGSFWQFLSEKRK